MERLTQRAFRAVIQFYGIDDKPIERYELLAPHAGLSDVCNVVDYLRNTGLQEVEPAVKTNGKAVAKK